LKPIVQPLREGSRTQPVFRFFTNPIKGNGFNACAGSWGNFFQGVNGRAQ
jgi:hypothetical protein